MKKIFIIPLLITLVLISSSCGTRPTPACVKPGMKRLEIRWGTNYSNVNKIWGYLLNSDGELFSYEQIDKNFSKSKIGDLQGSEFCDVLSYVNDLSRKTQVLNEVGDTLKFIEYYHPEKGIHIRFSWVDRFKTKASDYARNLYEKLLTYVKKYKK